MTTSDEALLPHEWPGSYYIDEQEIENVNKVLLSRSPFRYYGHDVQHYADQVEAAFRRRLDRKYAVGVNSGTAALAVALSAVGVGPGDEVLIPAYMWVSCLATVVRAGAIPRLVEIDESFCMDPDDLARKIGPHSKLVMLVHMNGTTGKLDQLLEVAHSHNLPLMEDVSQANGGSFKGKPLGSYGDLATFSFQYNKNMTSGEGGMVVCNDESIARRMTASHDLGYPRDENGRVMMDDAEFQLWGQGSRLNEVSAAMLVAQEAKLNLIVGQMQRASRRLYAGLAGIAGAQPRLRIDPDGDSGCIVLLTWPDVETCQKMTEMTRAAGVRNASGGGNVPVEPGWGFHLYYRNPSLVHRRSMSAAGRPWTDPLNAFAANYSYEKGALPQSDDLFARSSTLMVAPTLSDAACDRIIEIFQDCAKRL